MPRTKNTGEPNVNEARENIKRPKEAAKSKAAEVQSDATDSTTKRKTPPSSPNAKVPAPTPTPTPEGTF